MADRPVDRAIPARRLRTQHLVGPPLPGPVDVVRHLGGVQSQDLPAAMWALAQRCGIPTQGAIGEALDAGAILRTHVLRPTWHLVAPEDLRWMLRLTGPRVLAGQAARHRELGLDGNTFSRAHRALENALKGGRYLPREQVAAALVSAGIPVDGQRLVHILLEAEMREVICSGPRAGKKQTHMLVDERVPAAPDIEADAAAVELAVRYFTSHGPAQLSDFTWWSSLTVGQARKALEDAGERLASETVGGRRAWFSTTEQRAVMPSPLVRLLPNYDEYVVAYRERSDFYDRALDPLTIRGGVMANVVVVDGRAVGNWSRRLRARSVELVVVPWVQWSTATWDALAVEAGRFSRHLGIPVTLEPGARSGPAQAL